MPIKKPQVIYNIFNESAWEQQEKVKTDHFPTAEINFVASIWGKNSNDIMRSDKIPTWNYQKDYLKYEFATTLTNDKPYTKCIFCPQITAYGIVGLLQWTRHLESKPA